MRAAGGLKLLQDPDMDTLATCKETQPCMKAARVQLCSKPTQARGVRAGVAAAYSMREV